MLPGLVLTKSSSLKVGLEAREEGYCSVRFDILDCSKPFLSICKVIYILSNFKLKRSPIQLISFLTMLALMIVFLDDMKLNVRSRIGKLLLYL